KLPLSANGKINRRALPEPNESNVLTTATIVAPRTATEERLAQVLCSLLDTKRISMEDDFFQLGGHSLLGTQLVARIREVFGVAVNLRLVFESPTIAALAEEIDKLAVHARPNKFSVVTGGS